MATFTPPATLDGTAATGANRVPPYDATSTALQRRLFRHIRQADRSPNIYRTAPGVFTHVEPFDLAGVTVYLGAHATPITTDEETELTAAGYGAGITP